MVQQQPQLDAFMRLVGMLEEVIFNGSTSTIDREFYTIPHPGLFVSPTLTDRPNSDDMGLISDLFNITFDSTVLFNPQLSSVDQLYSDILQQAALPKAELTNAEQQELDDLEEELLDLFDNYAKYKLRHDEILGEIYRAQEANQPADVIAALEAKRQYALQEWKIRGRKNRYENAEAEVAYYRSVSPRRHFLNLSNRFDQHTALAPNLGNYQSTYLQPPIHEWSSPYAGWAQFTKTFKYTELHKKSKHTKWSGSVGLNFGLFKRISIGANGEKIENYEKSENTDIELKFEYLRVRILRPWLVPDLFLYRFWAYKKAFGHRVISSGYTPGSNEALGPKGLMPVLPTDFVIARNVSISANFNQNERNFIQETISGSVSGGWGPFSARGSYSTTTTQEDVYGSFDGTTLKIAHPQIIGFLGTLLPMTPNPDRRLPWTGDQDFGDDPEESMALANVKTLAEIGNTSDSYLDLAKQQNEMLRGILRSE